MAALPRRDSSLTAPLTRLVQRSTVALRRYRKRRASGCLRCGGVASVTCSACAARVCDRCWLLSIETGSAAALCLDCIVPSSPNRLPGYRTEPAGVFQAGARTVAWACVATAGVLYWEQGWTGPWRLVAVLLQPAVLLGLVPLAFLLGAFRTAALRALRAIFREPSDRSPSVDRWPPS